MITVISGTNRPNSKTALVALKLYEILALHSPNEVGYIDLATLNIDFVNESMYSTEGQHPWITELQDQLLIPSSLWIIVSPEYNGSYPGILKLFIDAISVRKYNQVFKSKKLALVGLADGRAGNMRGMEHLTGLFHYLGVLVMPNKLPLSSFKTLLDEHGEINAPTVNLLEKFLEEVVAFKKMN